MRRSTLLGLTIWAAWGTLWGCEAEPQGAIGTAEFHPWPAGSAGHDGARAKRIRRRTTLRARSAAAAGERDARRPARPRAGKAVCPGTAACPEPVPDVVPRPAIADSDCGSALPNQTFRCNRASRRCEGFAAPCHGDAECIPGASQWLWACSSDADCFFFDDDVCVKVAGVGRCARAAPDGAGGGCAFPVPDLLVLPRFDGTTVRSCADAGRKCHQGSCIVACRSDRECNPIETVPSATLKPVCATARSTRTAGAPASRCNTATRRCECAGNDKTAQTCPAPTPASPAAALQFRGGVQEKGERTFSGTRTRVNKAASTRELHPADLSRSGDR